SVASSAVEASRPAAGALSVPGMEPGRDTTSVMGTEPVRTTRGGEPQCAWICVVSNAITATPDSISTN
ncbi:MAG: hypothetical protein RIS35_1983, partial [Pseudomonadota bacterium]